MLHQDEQYNLCRRLSVTYLLRLWARNNYFSDMLITAVLYQRKMMYALILSCRAVTLMKYRRGESIS